MKNKMRIVAIVLLSVMLSTIALATVHATPTSTPAPKGDNVSTTDVTGFASKIWVPASYNSKTGITTAAQYEWIMQTTFSPGDTVYFELIGQPQTVTVTDPNGDPVAVTIVSTGQLYPAGVITNMQSGLVASFVASTPGYYDINYPPYTREIAAASVFVLPESVVGALAALGAGLAAFGIFQYKRGKK